MNTNLHHLLLFSFILLLSFQSKAQSRIYVDQTATGKLDGTSWKDAYKSIDSAFANSFKDDTIWIKAGRYYPEGNKTTSRFNIPNGRNIYGGFAGTETQLTQRNLDKNRTYLDGDVGKKSVANDNCRTVIYANKLSSNTIVDGFSILNGYAYTTAGGITVGGGGARLIGSKVSFKNCRFYDNYTYMRGAAIYSQDGGTINIENCEFFDNNTGTNIQALGGAIFLNSGNLNISNSRFTENSSKKGGALFTNKGIINIDRCQFDGNQSTSAQGGAIYIGDDSRYRIYNSLFVGNYATTTGSAIYYSSVFNTSTQYFVGCTFADNYSKSSGSATAHSHSSSYFQNCIFWGNTSTHEIYNLVPTIKPNINNCVIEGGMSFGTNVIKLNPQFESAGDANNAPFAISSEKYSLKSNSPAVDAGDSTKFGSSYKKDILGNNRVQGSQADIGAFESDYEFFKLVLNVNPKDAASLKGAGSYLKGTKVKIESTPTSSCYQFLSWKESDTVLSNKPTLEITLNQNRTINANYKIDTFKVQLISANKDMGTVKGSATYYCSFDTLRKFEAIPKHCHQFEKWTENGKTISNEAVLLKKITEPNQVFTAHFKKIKYELKFQIQPLGAGTASGSGSFNCDSTIEIIAKANTGYEFDQWIENSTIISKDSKHQLKMDRNKTVTAQFKKKASIIRTDIDDLITVYPSPANMDLNIDLQNEAIVDVRIISLTGSIVSEGKLYSKKNKISVQGLSNGIYYIEIRVNDKVSRQKFLVHNH